MKREPIAVVLFRMLIVMLLFGYLLMFVSDKVSALVAEIINHVGI